MSWNCWGLGNILTIRRLKKIYPSISTDIMFLMEKKNNDEFIKSKRESLQYPNFYYVPPIGLSGGLCVLWKDSVNINILEACPNVINSEIKFKGITIDNEQLTTAQTEPI
ncbi:hypothetical protein N665_1573s0001 [Sinapis alba]|nr:hypothetical protein N665_1573s0001 [Sinapis alba]